MLDTAARWLSGAPFGARAFTRLDVLLAATLTAFAEILVTGAADRGDPRGGVVACLFVPLMTVPVAWRSAAPLSASAALAVAAILNATVAGDFVRCGATLPALALVVYAVGARCAPRPAALGASFAVISAVAQGLSDPQLKHGFLPGGCLVILALWWAGRIVRSRDGMVAALRAWTEELQQQRDRTARLAVSADKVQIASELDGLLQDRIRAMSTQAAAARHAIQERPEAARASLTMIELEGRRTLSDMREIVGALRDEHPVGPQPAINDLDALLRGAVSPSTRVTIEGERLQLPAGLELSVFRIVERLIEPLESVAGARVNVTLRYAPEALAVVVRGPVRAGADLPATLTAAREWTSLYAGRLETRSHSGIAQTDVRLPLVSAHA